MGTEKVKEYLANFGLADRVMEFKESSATVAEADRKSTRVNSSH